MPDEERIEQLELEIKVLRANNKGLKDKIDEQSKEIEELKEDRDEYKEEYIKLQNARYYNYISKDKIKAKIEEYEKEIQIRKNVINNDVLDKQTIEKARIEWACMEDFIYEMQSLLEKE